MSEFTDDLLRAIVKSKTWSAKERALAQALLDKSEAHEKLREAVKQVAEDHQFTVGLGGNMAKYLRALLTEANDE